MPYINVKTNAEVSKKMEIAIKSKLASAIETSFPGKTENWLMINVEGFCAMYFGGVESPCAMFEVDLLGKQTEESYDKMTDAVCAIAEEELKLPRDRVYVKYGEYTHWGWNGMNF